MTHEETNLRTKEMLSQSLKKFMIKKPLGKITVSEIIADCNVNRKTFYYHFENIYALLKWTLEQEAVEVVKQFDLLVDYADALRFVMDYVDSNAHILNCAYNSMSRDELKRFFFNDFYAITKSTIEKNEEKNNITLSDETREFICNFLTEGIAGMIVSEFRKKNHCNKEATIKNAGVLVEALPEILVRMSENEKRPGSETSSDTDEQPTV